MWRHSTSVEVEDKEEVMVGLDAQEVSTEKGNDENDDAWVEKASKKEKASKRKKATKVRKSRSLNELQENKEERSVRSTKSSRKRKSKKTKKSKKEGEETVLLSPTMQNATFDEFGTPERFSRGQ